MEVPHNVCNFAHSTETQKRAQAQTAFLSQSDTFRFQFGGKRPNTTHVLALSKVNIRFGHVPQPAPHLTIEQQQETVKSYSGRCRLAIAGRMGNR